MINVSVGKRDLGLGFGEKGEKRIKIWFPAFFPHKGFTLQSYKQNAFPYGNGDIGKTCFSLDNRLFSLEDYRKDIKQYHL
jgi:hypothetical protein